jgi:arginase family enzyme
MNPSMPPKFGVLSGDAHSDANDPDFGDNPCTHSTLRRSAIEMGPLDSKRVVTGGPV